MKRYHIYIMLSLSFIAQNIPAKQQKTAACLEYAAMKVGEFGKDLSAATLFVLGEIAEKGINIRRFHFAGSLDGIEQGVLPQVEIEGIVAGKQFHIAINVTDDDLKAPRKLITKIAEAIKNKEDTAEKTQLIVPTTKEVKE